MVETLVALTIIAGMAGVLFEVISTDARATHAIDQKRQAIMLARSLLAQGSVPRGDQLEERGHWRDLNWTISHRQAVAAAQNGVQLDDVLVSISNAGTGRSLVAVRTLRLAR
ncbi:MAG: hypothetical protein J7498_01945 [Sphingobium sp.]|nr:hypothetical protein [Sphingobium sp.]